MTIARWFDRLMDHANRQTDPDDDPGVAARDVERCDACQGKGMLPDGRPCPAACLGGLVKAASPAEEAERDDMQALLADYETFLHACIEVRTHGWIRAAAMRGMPSPRHWHPWFVEAVTLFNAEVAAAEHERRVDQAKQQRQKKRAR